MPLVEWKDEYTIGIESIDAEHRWLIDTVNHFDEACREEGNCRICELLADLIDYIHEHFNNEENLMSRYRYPGIDAHKTDHKKLAQRVHELEHRWHKEGNISSPELAGFMIEWFFGHIVKKDRAFGEFVHTVGEE